jgi:hypothetical protein
LVRFRRRRNFENGAANFQKEAKAAALQLRSPAGCGGEGDEFKRASENGKLKTEKWIIDNLMAEYSISFRGGKMIAHSPLTIDHAPLPNITTN